MTENQEKYKKWTDKLYMLYENELWLREQAAKGRILKKFDNEFAYFTEAAAEDIRYKIVVLNGKNAENQVKIIERQGFALVGSHEEYYIFCINGKYEHIEPRFNEEMIKFTRKWFNKQMLKRFAGIMIVLSCLVIQIFINWGKLIQSIVELPTIWWPLCGLTVILLMVNGIRESRALLRTRKCLFEQEQYFLRRSRLLKISTVMFALIAVCGIIAGISFLRGVYIADDKSSISDIQAIMPIVLLQDIEQNKEQSDIHKYSQNTISEENYAEINHTFMSPKQYSARQKNANNSMMIIYYEVAVEKLVKPLTRELSRNSLTDIKKENLEKVDFGGLDAVYTWQANDFINVSACKGKKVMYIFNVGDMQMEDLLKEMAEVL